MTNLLLALTIAGSVALVVFLVLMAKRWRSEEREREAQLKKDREQDQAKQKRELREKIEAGTHVEDGRERCVIKPCPHAATQRELHFARDDRSFDAWVRRRFGAQPRLRIVLGSRVRYCVPHAALLLARYQHRAADHEAARASFLASEDADLAEFEHTADEAVVVELAARREMASVPPPSSVASSSKAPAPVTSSVRRIP